MAIRGRPKSEFPENLKTVGATARMTKSGKEKLNAKLKVLNLTLGKFLEKLAEGEFDVVKK
jgi:hypothetical protein